MDLQCVQRPVHAADDLVNNEPFSEHFIAQTSAVSSGEARYGMTPAGHWGPPEWIDEKRAAEARAAMGQAGILYGDNAAYRDMCRYQSGFFFRA